MEQFGEIIHGHYGQYVTRKYGIASENEKIFLAHTEIGKHSTHNYMLYLGSPELPSYIWSTCAFKKNDNFSASYQHVVYQDYSLINSLNILKLLYFPFMDAEMCNMYFDAPEEIFCAEKRKEEIYNKNINDLPEVKVPKDLLASLACYCVYKSQTHSKDSLRILVPESEINYDGYCLSVIGQLLSVIPVGMRKDISIATNPSIFNERYFGIVFQREAKGETLHSIRLDNMISKELLQECFLPSEVKNLISACVDNPALVERCYQDMEVNKTAEELYARECYSEYYISYILNNATFNVALMKKLNDILKNEQNENRFKDIIKERIKDMQMVEKAFEQDNEFRNVQSVSELLGVFECYEYLLDYLRYRGMRFSEEFFEKALVKIVDSKSEESVKKNCDEIQENESKFKQLFSEQSVKKIIEKLEKKRISLLKIRLYSEIINNPTSKTVEKAFKEISILGDDVKKEFGELIFESISNMINNGGMDENEVIESYFFIRPKIDIVNPEYNEIYAKIYIKKEKEAIKENLNVEEIEEKCKIFRNYFPTYICEYVKEISKQLLSAYSSMELEKNEYLSDIIGILMKYSADGILDKLLEIYIKQMELKVQENPREEEIYKLIYAVNKLRPDKLGETVKDIITWVINEFQIWENNEYNISSYMDYALYCISLRDTVIKVIEQVKYNIWIDKNPLLENFEQCFVTCLRNYLEKEFCSETVKNVFYYSKELSYINKNRFINTACEIIQKKYENESMEAGEIKQICEILDENYCLSGGLKTWYYFWIHESERLKKYNKILQDTETFNKFFYYCRRERSLLECIPEGREKFCEDFIKKFYPQKLKFSSFLLGIYATENELSFSKLNEKIEDFYYFYKRKQMVIFLDKGCSLFEIISQINFYEYFLRKCKNNKVYFYSKKWKKAEGFEIDQVRNVIHLITNISNQIPLDYKQDCLDIKSKRYAEILLPYFRLKKNNYKNLVQSKECVELGKVTEKYIKDRIVRRIFIAINIVILFFVIFVCIF